MEIKDFLKVGLELDHEGFEAYNDGLYLESVELFKKSLEEFKKCKLLTFNTIINNNKIIRTNILKACICDFKTESNNNSGINVLRFAISD